MVKPLGAYLIRAAAMAASQAASRIQVDARMPNQRLHIVRHATTMAEAQHVETRMPFLPRQQSSIKFHVLRDNRLAAKQSLLTVQCLAWRMVMDLTCVRRCCRVFATLTVRLGREAELQLRLLRRHRLQCARHWVA